jgi:hypothetical protein
MKYGISTRPHCVRSPRLPFRVPAHVSATPPSSPYPFTRPPRGLGLTDSRRFLTRRRPFNLSLYPTAGPLNPIQSP